MDRYPDREGYPRGRWDEERFGRGYGGDWNRGAFRDDWGREGYFGGPSGYPGYGFGGQGGWGREGGFHGGDFPRGYGGSWGWGNEPQYRGWGSGREPYYGGFGGRGPFGGAGSFAGRGPRNYQRTDERIREEVCDRLSDHPGIDATGLDVSVRGGEITLQGLVDDRFQKRMAEDLAGEVSGVKQVHNQLRVEETSGAGMAGGTTTATTRERTATGAARERARATT